jgi:plastocyanin
MRRAGSVAISAALALACGCSKGDGAKKTSKRPAPTKQVDPEQTGAIGGVVRYDGAASGRKVEMGTPECRQVNPSGVDLPEVAVADGKLQNAFVWVKEGLDDYAFDAPTKAVEIDQKGCMYAPYVSGAQVGQPIAFVNSDSFSHNINARPKEAEGFNFALTSKGQKIERTFDEPEVMVKLRCDIHPWMTGWVGVVAHPFFAVTGADGAFDWKGVPAGELTVAVWHETLGERTEKVTLAPKDAKKLELVFAAK